LGYQQPYIEVRSHLYHGLLEEQSSETLLVQGKMMAVTGCEDQISTLS
jgi:hypothetical protein